MSKFLAAIRRLFASKGGDKNQENEFQKAPKKLHPYDEVNVGEQGPNVTPEAQNDVQTAKRAPRSYEQVDLPPNGEGKVQVQEET